jgi:hypothetical protein
MDIQTLAHTRSGGWGTATFPGWDSARTLVAIFGPSSCLDDPGPLAEVVRAYPSSHVIGCSTSGEIHGTSIEDDSLAVAVCRFERTLLRSSGAEVGHEAGDSAQAGRHIAATLMDDDLRSVLVLSDGIRVNGAELVRGMNEILPPSVIVTGGLAGDGDRFQRTWVTSQGRPAAGRISAIGFYGDHIHVTHGSKGGWDPFGPLRIVTRSQGNVVHEIDGRPALALYKEYLGDRAAGLPATALLFPLGLLAAGPDAAPVVRTILSIDEDAQSMTFAGDVPQGRRVQLMRASFGRLVEGAADAGREAAAAARHEGPGLAIAISCVGRRLVLGQRAEDEVEAARDALPPEASLVGFYSYGEIAPSGSGPCSLHNQTMTLTHFQEI